MAMLINDRIFDFTQSLEPPRVFDAAVLSYDEIPEQSPVDQAYVILAEERVNPTVTVVWDRYTTEVDHVAKAPRAITNLIDEHFCDVFG